MSGNSSTSNSCGFHLPKSASWTCSPIGFACFALVVDVGHCGPKGLSMVEMLALIFVIQPNSSAKSLFRPKTRQEGPYPAEIIPALIFWDHARHFTPHSCLIFAGFAHLAINPRKEN